MDHPDQFTSPRTPVHITDEEHTLILMLRTMPLGEIIYVMMLNNFLPIELPNKYDHIANIINLHFQKSYEVHKVRAIIEFISMQTTFSQMFQQHDLDEMIHKYQKNRIAEFDGVCELYLWPYTTKCIQCEKQLKSIFSHRSKTVLSLTKTFKARKLPISYFLTVAMKHIIS